MVDGLDECSGLDSLEFDGFCTFLSGLARPEETRSAANILIFSRPGYPAIQNATRGHPSIGVDQGANAEDIGLFISDRSKTLTRDTESLKQIQDHLQDSADGMFLWVFLTIDSIKQERTPKKMKAAAINLPKGLSGAYANALRRIISKETSIRALTLKALLWAANSKKPLSEAQLLEALAIEPGTTSIDDDEKLDGTQLTTDCEDLLVLKNGHYMLLHPSLGDFLRTLPDVDLEGLRDYWELQANVSRILVEDCIIYLNFVTFATGPKLTQESFDRMLEDHPFIRYAGMYWGDHLRDALEQENPRLKKLALDLLHTQHSRELLHQIYLAGSFMPGDPKDLFPLRPGTTPLHLLSIFGLHSLLNSDTFSPPALDLNQADGLGLYAIDYALRQGRQELCRWIVAEHISRSCGINRKKEIRCDTQTWLIGAVVRHHWTDLLSDLLKIGYSAADCHPISDYRALHLAASLGYVDMVELFLTSGADPNMRDAGVNTPLIVAAAYNRREVMRTLLRRSVNVCHQRMDGPTALHLTAGFDDLEMAEDLLSHGASIQARWMDRTPLHVAAESGCERVISLFLHFGANKEATTGKGQTPLMIASQNGRADAVRVLLRHGANIAATAHSLATALHYAARYDYAEVVSIILAAPEGSKLIDQRGQDQFTPLWEAAHSGKIAAAVELLDHGAQVNPEDDGGSTPALISLRNGHTSMALLLFDKYHADPKHVDHNGGTSLHMIAKSGRCGLIQKLLSCGVNPGSRDCFGRSALYYAVEHGHKEFVESFVESASVKDVFEKGNEFLGESPNISICLASALIRVHCSS